MVRKLIKRILPKSIIWIYKVGVSLFSYKRRIDNLDFENNILIGSPIRENIGDHLITVAEKEFLMEATGKATTEIPVEVFKLYRKKIKKNVPNSSIIYIQGGGWLGDVWRDDELFMQDIISTFENNKVIIFPQTVYYEDEKRNVDLIERGRALYERENVYLTVREEHSYDLVRRIFPQANVFLLPDITLYLCNHYNYSAERNLIGICLRNDREIITDACINENLPILLADMGYRYEYMDTLFYRGIKENEREEIINAKIKDFAKYSLVITDRLHGMIISYLAKTPCIALDNKTHKVESVYNTWLKDCPEISLCDNICDIGNQIVEMSGKTVHNMFFDFSLLKEIINGKNP